MTNFHPLPPLDDRAVEALIAGRLVPGWEDLSTALGLLRSVAAGPVPAPHPELAVVLETGFQPVPVPAPDARQVRWGVRLAVGLAACTGLVLSAATANALPAPIQDAVADTVDAVTPFQLPRPDPGVPAVDGTGDDRPMVAPSAAPTAPVTPADGGSAPLPAPAVASPDAEAEAEADADLERADDERADDEADAPAEVEPGTSIQPPPEPEETEAAKVEGDPDEPDEAETDDVSGVDD